MAKKKPHVARLDPHTPQIGLFKVRPKNAPRLQAEEYIKKLKGDWSIEYVTARPLNDLDMRIFIAAMALCTKSPQAVNAKNADQANLWDQFLTEGSAQVRDAALARTTAYALADAAGLEWGANQSKQIAESLKRLSGVTTTWYKGERQMSGSRILGYKIDKESGELVLAISPLLAKGILGHAKQHTRISLNEMRQLTQPASRILHLILSGRLGVGGKGKDRQKRDFTFHVDGLAVAAYGEPTSPAMKRKRRMYIREALDELDKLDHWLVSWDDNKERAHITHWNDKNIEDLQTNLVRLEKVQRQLDGLDPPDDIEEED